VDLCWAGASCINWIKMSFAKYSYSDQVKEDEMGRACSMYIVFWLGAAAACISSLFITEHTRNM
jgi:hypothetical protein